MSKTPPQLILNKSIFSGDEYRARTDGARSLILINEARALKLG